MSTIFKSSRNTIFHLTENRAEKNGRPTGPINDDLALTLTWNYPPKQPLSQARLPGCGQEVSPP